MSDVIWKINGVPVDQLGVTVAGGTFRTQGISYALLDVARNFDAADVTGLSYGSTIALSRTLGATTLVVFRGKIAPIGRRGSPEYEGHDYPIEDAWADLERTTYQEPWAVGVGSFFFPKAVLGLNAAGAPLTIGSQISAIIAYAASVGVSIQMGSTPAGEVLWPMEVENISCAEAINRCLEFHPDWVAWINHEPAVPTFNVTAVDAMPAAIFPTNGTGRVKSFREVRRDDLQPRAVRIVYEWATTIDDEVYRNCHIDQHPGTPTGGPGVICATIPLAGGQMQMQKSRVRTWLIPDSGEMGAATKKWLKHKYPQLKDVNLEHFTVTEFITSLYTDVSDDAANNEPPPISEQAPKLTVTTVSQIPRELVEGSIEEWMRKRVGRVHFKCKITAAEGAPTEAVDAIAKGFPPGWCVATNAISKLYKGVTQWAPMAEIPTGIAAGVYASMTAAWNYEGEVTISEGELSGTRHHAKRVTLQGAGTNNAPVHTVSWDVGSGETTIGFGPVPELAPADFLELQRRVRSRKVTWWSTAERADNKLGSENSPSAAGDTVGGYYTPQTVFEPSTGGAAAVVLCAFGSVVNAAGGGKALKGGVVICGDKNFNVADQALSLGSPGTWLVSIKLQCESNRDDDNEIFMGGIKTSAATPVWHNKVWAAATDYDPNVSPVLATGIGSIVVPLGKLVIAAGVATFENTGCGMITVDQCNGILTSSRA